MYGRRVDRRTHRWLKWLPWVLLGVVGGVLMGRA